MPEPTGKPPTIDGALGVRVVGEVTPTEGTVLPAGLGSVRSRGITLIERLLESCGGPARKCE